MSSTFQLLVPFTPGLTTFAKATVVRRSFMRRRKTRPPSDDVSPKFRRVFAVPFASSRDPYRIRASPAAIATNSWNPSRSDRGPGAGNVSTRRTSASQRVAFRG